MRFVTAAFIVVALAGHLAHTSCEALELCENVIVLNSVGQPQMLCKGCVSATHKGQHRTLNPTKGFVADHPCAWDSAQQKCVRRKKKMKANFAVSDAECEAKVPLVTLVNDLDVTMGPNVKPVPTAVAQLDLSIDPDSLASFNRAPDGAVFVTFVVMPAEEVQEAHRLEPTNRADPNAVCKHPTTGAAYAPGTLFMAPGTARTDGADRGKHTPFPWDANNKPRVGGHEQQELLPSKQPHLELMAMLCGGRNSKAASLFVGGALFKNVKGQNQNDYRWTSGGVNSAHQRWMGNNKQGKPVLPAPLQQRWNAVFDRLLHGLPEPVAAPQKLSSQARNDPKNKASSQLHHA